MEERVRVVSRVVICATLATMASSTVAPAQSPITDEIIVTAGAAADQANSDIASSPDGDFVVVWQDEDSAGDGSGYSVKMRLYASDGTPLSSESVVNTHVSDDQRHPAVEWLAGGGFVVAWESLDQVVNNRPSTHAQLYDSSGVPVAGEFQVSTGTTGNHRLPSIASAADGSFVVAFQSGFEGGDGDGYGVSIRRFDSAGNGLGDQFRVNTYTTESQRAASIAMRESGDFVVSWMSYGQDGDSGGIFSQRFDSAGSPVGSETQVNTITEGRQGFPGNGVAMAPDGSFMVVWTDLLTDHDGDGGGVFGRFFDSTGLPVGEDMQVNTYTTGSQSFGTEGATPIDVDNEGRFLVVWQRFDASGRLFGADGQPRSEETMLNSYVTNQQARSTVATADDGTFVVAWQSRQSGSGLYDIVVRRFETYLFQDGFESGDTSRWDGSVGF